MKEKVKIEFGCGCKYCSDSKRVQTTKEIGENYNYSCKSHKVRSELKWVLQSYVVQKFEDILIELHMMDSSKRYDIDEQVKDIKIKIKSFIKDSKQ